MPLPSEPFVAPEDALAQITRALERHAQVFGATPAGMWPSEGSVSPEVVELMAKAGVRWAATDEGVLWASLSHESRKREALYRPWRVETASGSVALFFRDHELSDRIGFVYQHWDPEPAAADLIERVRRIGREHRGAGRPVVSIILDGENCWEYYADDGGPFLEALYTALEAAPDIRTRTPSEVLSERADLPTLSQLHSGSWINSDFHIWIGHPEKNRAWELLARARRALAENGSLTTGSKTWESLAAAEGSDWFWWFGDDHFTADKAVFDRLFRAHLQAAYEHGGLPAPGWLEVPIASLAAGRDKEQLPLSFIHPRLDGHATGYYEWYAAGRHRLGAGGASMHRGGGLGRDLFFGFDPDRLYLRIDFASGPPGAEFDLMLELLAPRAARISVRGLEAGQHTVRWLGGVLAGEEVAGSECRIGTILELGIPFRSLGLEPGNAVEMLGHLLASGQSIETVPGDQLIRFNVPDAAFEAAMWSA